MFICKEHGEIKTEWCDDCVENVECDCTDITYTRFKDLTYDCEQGERTVTIRLFHCETCGQTTHAEI